MSMRLLIRPLDSQARWTHVKGRAEELLWPGRGVERDNRFEQYLLTITLVGFICSRYCPREYREEVHRWNVQNLKSVEEWKAFLKVVIEKYYPADSDDQYACVNFSMDDTGVFVATMCGLTFSKYCPPECKAFMAKKTIEDLWRDEDGEVLVYKMFDMLRRSVS